MRDNWIWLIVIWPMLLIFASCNQGVPLNIHGENSPPKNGTQNREPEAQSPNANTIPETENIEDHNAGDEMPSHSPFLDPIQQSLTLAAKDNLAQRIGIAPVAIQLIEIEPVEWADGSLGCLQPDEDYAQVVTPGFRILLAANGERYTYHTDSQQTVIYCDKEELQPLLGDASTDTVKIAKDDLAQKLGIPVDSIMVIAVIGQEFPIDAFQCQAKKEERAPKEVPLVEITGETILLSAAGHRYEYHASGETVVFCRQLN